MSGRTDPLHGVWMAQARGRLVSCLHAALFVDETTTVPVIRCVKCRQVWRPHLGIAPAVAS